jgi:CheY-like chemotaxis protein
VRAYSCDSLRELGFSVLEAADGHAGLRLLEHHPEIKLLFTDVGLPGLNGRELAEQARKRRPGLRILFTTGYARNAIVHQGRLDPGVELLTKPFSRPQLGLRIRQILDTSIEINEGELVALVVDDEPLVRMLLSEMLSDHGFRVVQASTAREALAAVERLPAIHLAIVDVGLPDRSGLEVTAELRTKVPSAKVVIASGYGQDTSKAFSVDNSVVSLAKPFDTAALTNALRTLGFNIAQ